ncbi:MAG: methyltransferase family protein [Gemmobacter sp.]
MRHLDYPPVWLAGCLGLALLQQAVWPTAVPGWLAAAGTGLALAGAAIMAAAAVEFARARTTIVPHRAPAALITGGIFRLSRNPIYLADALILAGLALRWGAWPSLVLVPAFVAVITARFVRAEEARLRAAFGSAFDAYAARTRRWI